VKFASIARRYARALFESARSAGRSDALSADFEAFMEQLRGSPELEAVLHNPALPAKKKQALISALQQRAQLDPLLHRFLLLAAHKGRLPLMAEIFAAYRQQVDAARGLIKVDARAAAELDRAQCERLIARLRELTGREIQLSVQTEPALLGGMVLRVGNRVIDASLRGQLNKLHTELAAG